MNPRRIDIEQPLDVTFGFPRNGYDCIRHFQRGFLYPKRKVVTAGELFALPWSKRLE